MFDVTTGLRFHTFELVVSNDHQAHSGHGIWVPALAVLLFEVVLNASSMFNHGNVRLPGSVDRRLRPLIVTPDMHSVHHSLVRQETDTNFGSNVPWWDRLLNTYRAQPVAGH